MNRRYPALTSISMFLKIIAVAIIIGGLGFSLWFLMQSDRAGLSRLISIAVMIGSLLVGILVYAHAELISCIMDIEYNTRAAIKGSSISDKQLHIARLQSEINEELKKDNR